MKDVGDLVAQREISWLPIEHRPRPYFIPAKQIIENVYGLLGGR